MTDVYGQTILSIADAYDAQLKPLGDLALAQLDAQLGERIIDVGCGLAQTCVQLADVVGERGSVLGIDVSPLIAAAAKERARTYPQIRIECADAETGAFPQLSFDALFSRFGVMAFSNPIETFSKFRANLKPSGRLSFVCWREFSENELDWRPFNAVRSALPEALIAEANLDAPFSFSIPTNVVRILEAAGFSAIEYSSHDMDVIAGDLTKTTDLCLSVGATGRVLRSAPKLREKVEPLVRETLMSKETSAGVQLGAAVWVFSARVE